MPADFSASNNLGKLPQQELSRGNGELVPVIDHEASIWRVIRQTLETFGYRVVTADDGSEALSIYVQRQAEIAAVVTDMMMHSPQVSLVPPLELEEGAQG